MQTSGIPQVLHGTWKITHKPGRHDTEVGLPDRFATSLTNPGSCRHGHEAVGAHWSSSSGGLSAGRLSPLLGPSKMLVTVDTHMPERLTGVAMLDHGQLRRR